MNINFEKLGTTTTVDSAISPREIFTILPEKHDRYDYPRDVQTEVWNQWMERRDERDIVLKMNTGSGKTVVGLLILKSCLNEGIGPAVYVAPDPYLVKQVLCRGPSYSPGQGHEYSPPRATSIPQVDHEYSPACSGDTRGG